MTSSRSRLFGMIAAAAIVVSACSSTAATPTAAPVATPALTAAVATSAAPVVTPTPAPTQVVVGSIPTDQLVTAGRLTMCSDIPYPPQEFFDKNGDPTGSDIDLGTEIALRLGLKVSVENTVFDTIIAALQGNKCDMIISAQNITADRLKQVDMIPYFHAGQSFVVGKGNPSNIHATTDLCGKSVGVENGTTEADHLNGTGDYKPADGLSNKCVAAGQQKIDVQAFAKDSDALLALQSGKVAAYFTDSPVAGYYTVQQPTLFEVVSGLILDDVKEGISVSKDSSKAGIEAGVRKALQSMLDDGTYLNILKKYGVADDAITSLNP
jgi:polar amino acid transport system substrate-binding protein